MRRTPKSQKKGVETLHTPEKALQRNQDMAACIAHLPEPSGIGCVIGTALMLCADLDSLPPDDYALPIDAARQNTAEIHDISQCQRCHRHGDCGNQSNGELLAPCSYPGGQ